MNSHPYDSWHFPSTSSCFNQAQSTKLCSTMENGRKLKSRTAQISTRTQMEQQPDPESLIETMKMADEMNLINLVDEVNDLVLLEVDDDRKLGASHKEHTEEEDRMEKKLLPRQAIIFDYTLQPVGMFENKRMFLPTLNTCTPPFLRPIVIDGIGVVKAYRNCCSTDCSTPEFPFVALMRCLFYWLAKGHSTVLCFPATFNPLISRQFNASEDEKQNLQQLTQYKMLMLFQAEHSKQWYESLLDNHRACLITTVSQWRMQMPNNLYTGVFSADGERDLGRKYVSKRMEECPERLLQPFFSQKGQLVFFSSFSSTGQSLAAIILDQSAVNNQQEFDRLNNLQLSFIAQCKNLKLLFDLMHDKEGGEDKRFRETTVMIKLLQRLKHFLP